VIVAVMVKGWLKYIISKMIGRRWLWNYFFFKY